MRQKCINCKHLCSYWVASIVQYNLYFCSINKMSKTNDRTKYNKCSLFNKKGGDQCR